MALKQTISSLVTVDGAKGEGGGQILRSSLSLSMVTGLPFKMQCIRAHRQKPGLMRQHLTCVLAAAEVCGAIVKGAELGSTELRFIPRRLKGGDYRFAIGTAGSTMLVAQTLIPALMLADTPSRLTIEGGTHNIQAPCFDFLLHSFLPLLKKMGISVDAQLEQHGFYPAGGGKVVFSIEPAASCTPLQLCERGQPLSFSAEAWFAHLDVGIAKRELKTVGRLMDWEESQLHIRQISKAASAGNVLLLKLMHEHCCETVVGFGRKGVTAEKVAEEACVQAKQYVQSGAAIGPYLADQLLLPLALIAARGDGGSQFTTLPLSAHTDTNINILQQFLECSVTSEPWQIGGHSDTVLLSFMCR